MFTLNISFKNFLTKNKNILVKKKLNLILKEKNQVICSLSKSYKDSFSKKNIKHLNKKSPDLSPVNALPVRVPPCAAGANPIIKIFASILPKPVTGFPQ